MKLTKISSAHWCAACVFVAIFGWLNGASARVIVSERTVYYSVSGSTGKQLAISIQKRGPKLSRSSRAISTSHAIATTKTELKVRNIKPVVRGGRCKIASAEVRLKLTYTLPRWRGSRRASKEVRRNWERFVAEVKNHELEHGRISKQFAADIDREIKRASGRVSRKCKNFGDRSVRKFNSLKRRADRRHARFDRREGRRFAKVRRLQRALVNSE